MRIKIVLTAVAAGLLFAAGAFAAPAAANPGPGQSFACAPGQQGNPEPAFKPPACDKP
jgi:hypothetical protein